VRFLSDRPLSGAPPSQREERGYPLPVEKPLRMFVADRGQPVQVTVLGPATLHVELRGLRKDPTAVTVRALPTRGGAAVVEHVELDGTSDPGAHGEPGRALAPTVPTTADLLLPEASPYRVTVQPERGRVLARAALRVDVAGATPPPLPAPWWQGANLSAILPWPALPTPLATITAPTWDADGPSDGGTFSVELSGGSQPIGDQDSALQNFEGVVQTVVAWRDQLADDRAWILVAPFLRLRQDTDNPIWGANAEVYLRHLPLDLRVDLSGGAVTQSYQGSREGAVTGKVHVDRSFVLTPTLSLVSALAFRGAWLSLDRARIQNIDADVYNEYLRTHPIALIPRAALWWTPYQDHIVEVAAFLATTRSLDAADYVGFSLDWRALVPVLGGTGVDVIYRPTWRLLNDTRPAAFTRHDLSAGLRWSLWTGATGRTVLGADTSFYISSTGEVDKTFTISLRYDWTRGRGLRDTLPPEQSFDVLVEDLPWEPTPPGAL
jgi:hypothetical protein